MRKPATKSRKHSLCILTLLSFFIFAAGLQAQVKSPFKKDNISFRGYMKDLQSIYFFEGLKNAKTNNILHNRLAYKWYASDKFTFNWEQRTQVHIGSLVSSLNSFALPPIFLGYQDVIQLKEDYLDLSYEYGGWEKSYFFTQIDRLWLEYSVKNFEVKLGRQRINWGMNLVWNPNDIFNSFNFVDFDYEERPGSDALYLNYYTGTTGQLSLAFQYLGNWDQSTIGMRYRWNKWSYDFQIFAARYRTHPTVGLGWAGDIKSAGFRGEALFISRSDEDDVLMLSVGTEYAFKNGWMIQAEAMYNSNGNTETASLLAGGLGLGNSAAGGPETLSPFKYSLFTGLAIPAHALWQLNFGAITSPTSGDYYGVVSANWNFRENWELLSLIQLTQAQEVPLAGFGDFRGLFNARIKYSF